MDTKQSCADSLVTSSCFFTIHDKYSLNLRKHFSSNLSMERTFAFRRAYFREGRCTEQMELIRVRESKAYRRRAFRFAISSLLRSGRAQELHSRAKALGMSHPRNFVCSCRSHRPFVRSCVASRFITSIPGIDTRLATR